MGLREVLDLGNDTPSEADLIRARSAARSSWLAVLGLLSAMLVCAAIGWVMDAGISSLHADFAVFRVSSPETARMVASNELALIASTRRVLHLGQILGVLGLFVGVWSFLLRRRYARLWARRPVTEGANMTAAVAELLRSVDEMQARHDEAERGAEAAHRARLEAEGLASLTKEQADSVRAALEVAVDESVRPRFDLATRQWWIGLAIAGALFVLGFVVSEYLL